MTLLDDDIDDLLQGFRADEAVLDDTTRARMWARICDEVPDAPAGLDAFDPSPGARRPSRRPGAPRRGRALAVAAAVLVLLAVAGLAVRSGPGDDEVTAGPAPEEPLPRDLQELADAVADRPVPVLGSSDDTRYTHLLVTREIRGASASQVTNVTEELWIDLEGRGRLRVGGVRDGDESSDEPGTFSFGSLLPREVVGLPDDPEVISATLASRSSDAVGPGGAAQMVHALAHAGIPGPARAGLLRYLDGLGFDPVTADGLGPNLLRVEGPGPDGSTVQVDLDLLTGVVVASSDTTQQGGRDVTTYRDADLRPDTRSR